MTTPTPRELAAKALATARSNHERATSEHATRQAAFDAATEFAEQSNAAQALGTAKNLLDSTKIKLVAAQQAVSDLDHNDLVNRRNVLNDLTHGDGLRVRLQTLADNEVKLRLQLLAAHNAREVLYTQLREEQGELAGILRQLNEQGEYVSVAIGTAAKNQLDRMVNAAVDAELPDDRKYFCRVAY